MDLSNRPYKVLKYHAKAVKAVHFSTAWNLVADASDDGTLQLFYAKVSADLGENLVLVPLKVLRRHEVKGGLGIEVRKRSFGGVRCVCLKDLHSEIRDIAHGPGTFYLYLACSFPELPRW